MNGWEKNLRKVTPYVPGEQPKEKGIIKLNTNENPYPPAHGIKKAIEHMESKKLRCYPDSKATILVEELADYYGVKKEQVFVGVGSDDVLALAFLTFFNSNVPILFPDITYSFYKVWAQLYQIPYETPKVDENFRINPKDYEKENGGIVIANPNAPTSICEPLSFLREILDNNQDCVVIVDEAYIDFGGESAIHLLSEYENLVVVQTYSKSRSLAGLRIGFAIANERLIEALSDVKYSVNSYTMNLASIELGVAALRERTYFHETVQKIVKTREKIKRELERMEFKCLSSSTNFLFVTHKKVKAKDIFLYLKEKKVYVRYFELPRIDNYLRITIGTEEEMQKVLEVLREFLL